MAGVDEEGWMVLWMVYGWKKRRVGSGGKRGWWGEGGGGDSTG